MGRKNIGMITAKAKRQATRPKPRQHSTSYTDGMVKRFLVIGSATALAALVLFLTMLADPAQTGPGTGTRLKPQDAPTAIPQLGGGAGGDQKIISSANQYRYSRVNEHGQLIQIFGKTLTPKPQGVLDVVAPGSRIHLTPSRVIEVRAESGTFVAPDNQPRNGDFKGRVVLTLFEGPEDRVVDLSTHSPDVALRVFMQDARFDLELGQIESAGPVHLTGPRVDFKGKGLTLAYSEVRKRVERLEIAEGRYIRLKPGHSADLKQADAAEPSDDDDASSPAKDKPAADKTAAKDGLPRRDPAQYYTAKLERRVTVSSRDIEADADELMVWFSLTGQQADRLGGEPRRTSPTTEPKPSKPTEPSAPTTIAPTAASPRPAAEPAPPPKVAVTHEAKPIPTSPASNVRDLDADAPLPPDETLAPPGIDDVTIAWTGMLRVLPLEEMPDRLTGAEDYALDLTGKPLRITTSSKDVITASSFDFLGSTGRIRLTGSDDHPLVLDSPNLGVLTGRQLVIDQSTGLGVVNGAGSLRAHGEPGLADAIDPKASLAGERGARLPRGMNIQWNDRIDLAFYLHPQREDHSNVNRLRALKDVMFRGDVVVAHPDFSVRSDRLNLSLDDPAKGAQSIEAINASGSVLVTSRDEQGEEMSIRSDQLVVELARDELGDMTPTRLKARGSVEVKQAKNDLRTGALDVGLGMALPTETTGDVKRNERRVTIRTMQADQGVTLSSVEPPLKLWAQRLDADVEADQVELFGLPDKPAQVEREGSTLTGGHIVVGQKSKTVHVLGPGRFAFLSRSSKPDAPANRPAQTAITVRWDDAMHFDDAVGLAQFTGKVRTQARTDRETSRLLADDLRLKFTHVEGSPKEAGELDRSGRAIHSVTARGGVLFDAESWQDEQQKVLGTRLTIVGDHMHFEEPREEVQVVGAGQMLFEDYRPERSGAGDASKSESPLVHFTGRGATLFKWKGRLLLDANHNDMLIQDRVQMVHRPTGKPDVLQLDCQNFLADLEETGGLGVWFSGNAPQPALKAVLADRDVRLLADQRTINTDHLQYTGSDQNLVLRAEPGRMVEIIDERDPTARTVREIRWDLMKNRVSFEEPSPAQIPLGR